MFVNWVARMTNVDPQKKKSGLTLFQFTLYIYMNKEKKSECVALSSSFPVAHFSEKIKIFYFYWHDSFLI